MKMRVFCVICFEHCAQDARMSVITNCGHVFHTACLTRWLRENLNCPQCRRDAGANSITNLFIDAGPERPSASPEDAFSIRFAPRPAFLEGRERTADQIIQQLRDQLDRHKEERDSMVQRTHLQIDEALKRYKYIEKMLEEGSAELDSSMINGERSWKNLAGVLKRRLNLVNAENRELKSRNKTLNLSSKVNRSSRVSHGGSPVVAPNRRRIQSPAQVLAQAAAAPSPAQAAAASPTLPAPNLVGHDWSFEYSSEMFRTPDNRRILNWNFYFR